MRITVSFVEPLVPDISLIFDVEKKQAWGTFDTKEEGMRPCVAFEITSPSTRNAELERRVSEEATRAAEAEEENARLRALIAQLSGET